jgi:hypothetical protein
MGTLIAFVPSEIVIVVEPLEFAPMPIDVATNEPVDAGALVVDTVTDAGDTMTIDVSLLVTVNVPLKPFSLTVNVWLAFTPPKAMLAGLATGVGDGVGLGVGEGVGVDVAFALPLAAAVGVLEAFGEVPPPPPQPMSTAKATIP